MEVAAIVGSVREAAALPDGVQPDVLVVDYRLPDGNGAEAVEAIRRSRSRPAVLFLSAVESPAALMAAVQSGARGYVTKTEATSRVVDAVRRVAAGQMLIPASALAELVAQKGEQAHLFDTLTPREREVLRLVASGLDNRALADALGIEYGTAGSHVRNLLAKLEVQTRMQAVVRAAELGLLEPEGAGLPHLD